MPPRACVSVVTLVRTGSGLSLGGCITYAECLIMWVCLLNKTAHMCTHVCVCVESVPTPSGFTDTPHCFCLLASVPCTHAASLLPPPQSVCKDTGTMGPRVWTCAPSFYFAHCSVTAAGSQLPPLPQRRSFGDIKGKPEKGYLEKRVARQPNTHHPRAPPTQNSVPGLQPD